MVVSGGLTWKEIRARQVVCRTLPDEMLQEAGNYTDSMDKRPTALDATPPCEVCHRCVYIGIGACVIQHVCIGSDVTVGAGAAVVRDLPDGVTAVGVPARVWPPN